MARDNEPESQAGDETDIEALSQHLGPPSGLTCPDCGGALWELQDGTLTHYRCHVGHQFTTEGLDAQQQDAVETALWSAVRMLEEHADLRRRMADRASGAGMPMVSSGFAESAREASQQAHTIRELLFRRGQASTSAPDHERAAPRAARKRMRRGKTRRPRR